MVAMMTPITNPVVLAQIATLQSELVGLQTAIASGATRVSYDGRSVDYDDLTGMKQRVNYINSLLTQLVSPGYRKPQAGFAYYNRGERRRGYGYGGFYGLG